MELSCPFKDTGFVPQVHRSCFGVFSHIINPLLTKLARSRWLDIGLIHFLHFELGQYPAILTSRLVNNPYLLPNHGNLFIVTQDHDAHGPEFLKHMQRINMESGANITVSSLL